MSVYYPPAGTVVSMQRHSTAHIVIAWIVTVITLGWMLPWAIAATRHHKDTLAIALISLFLTPTIIGWIIALVWSLSNPGTAVVVTHQQVPQQSVAVNVHNYVALPPGYSQPTAWQPEGQGYSEPLTHYVAPPALPQSATQPYPYSQPSATSAYPVTQPSADSWRPAPWDRPSSGTHG